MAIRPHPLAPLFPGEGDPLLVLQQISNEVSSGNYPASHWFIELIRQAGLVSLWFFLRHIASFNGPYEKLNEDLHLDMANFRQSDACMLPSARSACFTPRGFYKSSIAGHGANTWEATRNPEIRIRIVCNIAERAHDFKRLSQRTFDSNELFAACYPEDVPSKSQPRWNEEEFVLPSRQRYYNEPTISAGGATGASEGIHVDLLNVDDPEGLDDIDSMHTANMNMYAKKKWFNTNTTALLVDKFSRIHLNGTFYGADDIHAAVMEDAKEICGFRDPEFQPKESGHWSIYYRSWKEEEKVVFPEVMDEKKYGDLLKSDPWSALTQYANKPHTPGTTEFAQLETKRFQLAHPERLGEFVFIRGSVVGDDENFLEEPDGNLVLRMSSCDTVMVVDPAGTEKGMSARTSRSAILVVSLDSEENYYVSWARVGYFSVHKLFDLIFEGCIFFGGLIRGVFVESNAMQKIIAPLLQKEQRERGVFINPQPVMASGDKPGRIRMGVGRVLLKGKLWFTDETALPLEEEKKIFPSAPFRMDGLDALEKAVKVLSKPLSQEEELELEAAEEEYSFAVGRNRVTGY